MMLSSLLIFLLALILQNICNEVNSAGLPNQMFIKTDPTENEIVALMKNNEFMNNIEHQFESLTQVITKMDTSIQSLQEKSHTWAIFLHHIESWNDGIRILENKLDLLKRTQEEQRQQLNKLELSINHVISVDDHQNLFDEVKQFFKTDRKVKNDIFTKLNNILRHLPAVTAGEKQHNKLSNIMGPIAVAGSCSNFSSKLEQRLNNMSHQMAQQKDLKQLNSLEKRNSKSLEGINQILTDHLDKQEEITNRLQKSNECCYALSNELTTFTESSDILLKRIEKLVRNVSEKLNEIEVSSTHSVDEDDNNEEREDESIIEKEVIYENDDDEINDKHISDSQNIDNNEHVINDSDIFEDCTQEVEFVRPYLNGCHELPLDETDNDESTRINGIYKFSTPEINESERDFYERYCVYPPENDTGLPWTVIQHRGPYLQQENFNRSWSDYRNGFGHLSRDFWFGNEYVHRLVYYDDYELRIELEDFNGTQKWAEYSIFRIDSEKFNYNLLIGEYHGTIKDAMKYHNENDFSTYDRRNDKTVDACCSCAMGYASGWWFDNCSEANLNGIYHYSPLGHNYIGIMWELWHGDYSLKKTTMMIRPRNLNAIHTQDYQEDTEDP